MEKKVQEYAKREFNVDISSYELQQLLRGRNGEVYRKLFQTFMDNVVGEETYEKMQQKINKFEKVKELEQLEVLAANSELTEEEKSIKPVNYQQLREQKAFLTVLNMTANSLNKLAAESSPQNDGFSSSKLIQLIKEVNESAASFTKFMTSDMSDDELEQLESNSVVYDSPDELINLIEENENKINDLLLELKEMSTNFGHRNDEIKIDVEALKNLVNHKCGQRVDALNGRGDANYTNGDAVKTLDVTELNLIEFKKYQEERKLQAPKLIEKVEKANEWLKNLKK